MQGSAAEEGGTGAAVSLQLLGQVRASGPGCHLPWWVGHKSPTPSVHPGGLPLLEARCQPTGRGRGAVSPSEQSLGVKPLSPRSEK